MVDYLLNQMKSQEELIKENEELKKKLTIAEEYLTRAIESFKQTQRYIEDIRCDYLTLLQKCADLEMEKN